MEKVKRYQRNIRKVRGPLLIILAAALAMSVFAGCELMPVEEALPAIPIVKEYTAETYTQTEVLRGDLVLQRAITCKYGAAIVDKYMFEESMKGLKIGAVYVTEGQEVKAGTLLAELDNATLYTQITTQEGKISEQNLKIDHIKENRDLDIRLQNALIAKYRKELQTVQQTIQALTEWEAQENPTAPRPTESTMDKLLKQQTSLQQSLDKQQANKETVTESYEAKLDNAEASLTILQERLEELQLTLASRQLWAKMDGVVTHADSVENQPEVAVRSTVIVTDVTSMFFKVTGSDTQYFPMGTECTLVIQGTEYVAVAADPTEIQFPEGTETEGTVYLRIQGEQPILQENQTGTVTLTLDTRQDVLYVDAKAVHKAGGENYVYILGEDGLKASQTVTVGLKCDTYVEIVDGLSEGNLVILE